MKVSTRRFGEMEISQEKVIKMIKPVLGFESLESYILVEAEEMSPFMWLQSIEDPDTAFIVVNPRAFYPDYKIEINRKEVAEIKLTNVEEVETFVIATIPEDPNNISLNLQGPIVVNTENNLAKQLVMVDSDYKIAHFIMKELVDNDSTVEVREEPVSV